MPTLRLGLLMNNINHRKIGGIVIAFFPGYERLGFSVFTEAISTLKVINNIGKS